MKTELTIQKPFSPVRVTFLVILVASCLYPLFFAYIDRVFKPNILLRELLFTTVRLCSICGICIAVIAVMRRWFGGRLAPLRYAIELLLVLFLTYWFLIGFLEWIDIPLSGAPPEDYGSWLFRRYIGLFFLGTVFIYTFLTGLYIYQLAQKKAAQAEQLRHAHAQVRLQALKSQVNPHFLFNSLSVLSSLVHVDAEKSEQFIVQLSKAYRYILEQKEWTVVSLAEELSFLEAYFFLLQMRFGQKVRLEQEIDVDAGAVFLPPLSLQLLVENAVKHNKMSAAAPLVIAVRANAQTLTVANNRAQREQEQSSTGIGLNNIQQRYALLTDEKLLLRQTEDHFTVTIPLLKKQ